MAPSGGEKTRKTTRVYELLFRISKLSPRPDQSAKVEKLFAEVSEIVTDSDEREATTAARLLVPLFATERVTKLDVGIGAMVSRCGDATMLAACCSRVVEVMVKMTADEDTSELVEAVEILQLGFTSDQLCRVGALFLACFPADHESIREDRILN